MRAQDDRKSAKRLVAGWAKKLGKSLVREDLEHQSGYSHFMESKELDGLSGSIPNANGEFNGHGLHITDDLCVYNPNSDAKLLVEWSVDEKTRSEVIKETYTLLMVDQVQDMPITEDITEDDLKLMQ
jgi:hypothetical protein